VIKDYNQFMSIPTACFVLVKFNMVYSLTKFYNLSFHGLKLFRVRVFVGEWHSLLKLPQNSNAPTMHPNTPHFQTSTPVSEQMGANVCLLNNVAQDVKMINSVRLKLAKNTCATPGAALHRV